MLRASAAMAPKQAASLDRTWKWHRESQRGKVTIERRPTRSVSQTAVDAAADNMNWAPTDVDTPVAFVAFDVENTG